MRLSINEIAYLAARFEMASDISLFKNVKAAMTGLENLSLMEKGILVGDEIQSEAKALLNVVANANQCARVYLKDPNFIMEKYVYHHGSDYVLVENAGEELQFVKTSEFKSVIEPIGTYLGKSTIRSAAFETRLSLDAFMVYLAIVDIYRVSILKAYIGQESQATIDLKYITEALENPAPNALITMMEKNYGFKSTAVKDVGACVKELIQKGCIDEMGGLNLTPEHAMLAGRLLMPEMAMILEVISLDEANEISTASSLIISSGVRDNLSVTFLSGEVELATVTTEMLLELIEAYLKCPVS